MKPDQIIILVLTALVAVLGTLFVTGHYGGRPAYGQDSITSGSIIAIMGNEKSSRSPVLLVDTRAMTIMCYEYNWVDANLQFKAARSFRSDRLLADFWVRGRPTLSPAEVEKLVGAGGR